MKKRLVCLFLVLVTLLAVCSCSCIASDTKYDYTMEEYIKLPDYKNHTYELKEDDLKMAIGTYLLQFSSEYTVQRGDKIQVDIKFYDLLDPEVDAKGEEITELYQNDIWIEQVAKPFSDGGYQISSQVENGLLGSKIGATVQKLFTLDDDFFVEEYRGKKVFVDVTINNRISENGDVVLASYTGYHLDENGNIAKGSDGKDKTFDTSDNASFYIGSHLAIDDFENGLIGLMIGQEKDVYATFPEDYTASSELAGKKVMFRVKIKTFYRAPVYDDDFVKTYFSTFKTTKEFEDALIKEYTLSLVYDYLNDYSQVIEFPSAEYDATAEQLEEIAPIWQEQYSTTLDNYILATYGMTRDQYIKSNMKTEMIFYSLRNQLGEKAVPTDTEIAAKREELITAYKKQYMTESGLKESDATVKATNYVDKLGESYIYEQVMYEKIDEIIPTLVEKNTKTIPSTKEYIFDAKTK